MIDSNRNHGQAPDVEPSSEWSSWQPNLHSKSAPKNAVPTEEEDDLEFVRRRV